MYMKETKFIKVTVSKYSNDAEHTCTMYTHQYVIFACFLEKGRGGGGGGGESESLAKDAAFTRTAPGNEVECISNKQTEDRDKVFMQLPTRIYLTAALNFVTTHC